MVDEPVGAAGGPLRLAHPHEVGSQAPGVRLDVGNHVAPEIGRGRIAMQEDDGIARARVDIRQLGIEDRHAPARMLVSGGDR